MCRAAVSALVSFAVLVGILLLSTPALAAPTVTIATPTSGASYQDSVPVSVTIQSQYAITNVHAQAQSPGIDLTSFGSGGYSGTLNITALPAGAFTITVTATDALSAVGTVSVSVVHTLPPPPPPPVPTLTVTTLDGLALLPSGQLRLQASCAGTSAYPCTSLTATGASGTLAQTSGTTMDSTMSVASSVPNGGNVTFDAVNSGGVHATRTIKIVVITDPHYTLLESVGGTVLDFDANRILFARPGTTAIRDRASHVDTVLDASGSVTGVLTPVGALFNANGVLQEWRNGVLGLDPTLAQSAGGDTSGATSPGGAYEIWTTLSGAWFRDVAANVTIQVSTRAGISCAVAADGTAVYNLLDGGGSSVQGIWISTKGSAAVEMPAFTLNRGPVAVSASLIGYHQHFNVVQGLNWQIRMGACFSGLVSSTGPSQEPSPGTDYAGAGGWCATTKWADDGTGKLIRLVYTGSPSGTEALASIFNTDTTIRALGEDGSVAYNTANVNYLGKAGGGAPFVLSYGIPTYALGNWYLKDGTGLYLLDPNSDAGAPPPVDAGVDATVNDSGSDAGVDASDGSLPADAGIEAGADDGAVAADAAWEGGSGDDDGSVSDGASDADAGPMSDGGSEQPDSASANDGGAEHPDAGVSDDASVAADSGGAPGVDAAVADASVHHDGAVGDVDSGSSDDQGDSGGCSMSATRTSSSGTAPLLALLGLGLVRARRRRSSR